MMSLPSPLMLKGIPSLPLDVQEEMKGVWMVNPSDVSLRSPRLPFASQKGEGLPSRWAFRPLKRRLPPE